MAVSLVDDRYFAYAGHPILIDVLSNDIVPANYSLTETSSRATVVGNQIEVILDPNAFLASTSFNYTVTDTNNGQSDTALVVVTELSGTVGIGGFTISNFGTFSEDGGILKIDLGTLINPASPTSPSISNLAYTDDDFARDFNVSGTLSNNILSIDLDQLGALDDGETTQISVKFTSSNGSQSANNTIMFNVTGVTDPVTTISGVGPGGIISGDNLDNIIVSRANATDQLLGGNGSDVFRFQSDYTDGNIDRDTILDYQVGRDTLEFQNGSAIRFMFEVDSGVMISLDDGWDSLIIFGDDVTLSNVDASGLTDQASSGGSTPASGFSQSLQDYSDNFNWSIGLPSSSGFNPFPSPNPFIFDPFL